MQAPPTHTPVYHPAPPVVKKAPLGITWPSIAASSAPMTKAQRPDLASAEEKKTFQEYYALKVKQRTQKVEIRKRPSLRHRNVKDDAEELVVMGVNSMTH